MAGEFETRSPALLAHRYPRGFAFYLADPISSIHEFTPIDLMRFVRSASLRADTNFTNLHELILRWSWPHESVRIRSIRVSCLAFVGCLPELFIKLPLLPRRYWREDFAEFLACKHCLRQGN